MTTPIPTRLATTLTHFLLRKNAIAYAVIAPDLTIQTSSDNFAAQVGAASKAINGKHLTEVLGEFVGLEKTLQAIAQGQLPEYRLEQIQRENAAGETIYLTFHITPLDEQQHDNTLLLFIEDRTETDTVTQRLVQERNELRLVRAELVQANEDLQRLTRLKALFLSMAAHDLRTPLTVVLGFTQLLHQNPSAAFDTEQHEYLETIAAQAEWLDRMIGNLLAYDQIEAGTLVLTYERCNLNQLATEVQEAMRGMTLLKNQSLALDLPEQEVWVETDAERVRQILFNLMGNAVKFSPPGSDITLQVARAANGSVLRVADEGPGLTPEELTHLFEINYRAAGAQRRGVQASGLDLFVVKRLTEALNGRVAVTSKPKEGTTFTIFLPQTSPAK